MSVQTNPAPDAIEILIAEDSLTQAEQLRYLLEQHGYSVTVANDGKQALALVNDRKPALVISDIVMPELNGYQLCQRIKADERTRDVWVILLTSLSTTEDVLEGLICGADSFITKPYSADYLLAHVQQTLADRSLLQVGERARLGAEIIFAGKRRLITAEPRQMVTLLISTYEAAVHRNSELVRTQDELSSLNEHLEDLVDERTAALQAEISARQQAEVQLTQALTNLESSFEELQRFAYVAAHDLQEPLRMISSYVQLLARRYKGQLDTNADEFIAYAVEGVSQMKLLINGLQNYIEIATRSPQLVPTSSEAALTRALNNLQFLIEDNQARITHDPLPEVLGDESQLVQLFQQLIGNAVKFRCKAAPNIHIHAEALHKTPVPLWQFSVRDNGIGIDPQYFQRIFVICQRLHPKDVYPGIGFGLAICKKIVESHSGSISVVSQPGEGSTFSFTIRAPQ
jgi:signal transduction histidine kinase